MEEVQVAREVHRQLQVNQGTDVAIGIHGDGHNTVHSVNAAVSTVSNHLEHVNQNAVIKKSSFLFELILPLLQRVKICE